VTGFASAVFRIALIVIPALPGVTAAGLDQLGARLSEFHLNNGLRLAVLPRHDSPVVSVTLFVNSGMADEPAGKTGLATMFERLIVSGPASIGSNSVEAEQAARRAVETAIERLEQESAKSPDGFSLARQSAETDLRFATARLAGMADPQAFAGIMKSNGFNQVRASVDADSSRFQWSFPADRFELWCKLYSEWLLKPAFRDFYAIRDSLGKRSIDPMILKMLETVFAKHPYGRLASASSGDKPMRAGDAEAFLRTQYTASNMAVAVAGDIQPAQVRRLAEQYFGKVPAGQPAASLAEEVALGSELRIQGFPQNTLAIGYLRPAQGHPDSLFFDVLALVCNGEPERAFHEALVVKSRLAQSVGMQASLPGQRWKSLFVMTAKPLPTVETPELEKAMLEFTGGLLARPLEPARLQTAASQLRASILGELQSNDSASALLAAVLARHGSASGVIQYLDGLQAITPAEFQKTASRYLIPGNRVVLEFRKEAEPQ
jgi:predicted Zn-dependent peptidase